jgi:hypothetical protein
MSNAEYVLVQTQGFWSLPHACWHFLVSQMSILHLQSKGVGSRACKDNCETQKWQQACESDGNAKTCDCKKCFDTTEELRFAVDQFMLVGHVALSS